VVKGQTVASQDTEAKVFAVKGCEFRMTCPIDSDYISWCWKIWHECRQGARHEKL
jgi:hypothetical protein